MASLSLIARTAPEAGRQGGTRPLGILPERVDVAPSFVTDALRTGAACITPARTNP